MSQSYSKRFKEDAIRYVQDHPELTIVSCAEQLGINENTLHNWLRKARKGEEFRGQGNYSSDLEKENARLRRELKNATDALNILKKTLKIISE
ncbi:MAG: transposase [Eubacteriales bacterium]|nr:transposase [Eubacteriales bacterium]